MSRELLHPKARAMLEEMEAAKRPDSNEIPIEQARENLERLFAELGPGPDVEQVLDLKIPGPAGELPARLLRGRGAEPERPLIVFFHGGGYAQGSIATHELLCRGLANACRASVLLVEYRLAPEFPFPAAYDDAVAAVEWALARPEALGLDGGPVLIAGDSAGGNLAAAVCATIADPGRIAAQLLIYPGASFKRQKELFDAECDRFFLSLAELEHFESLYVPEGTDLGDPRLSPLEAPALAAMPPAVIVVAQCDPTHPQGEAMHERLLAEGVRSTLLVYQGMIHGFFGLTSLFDEAQEAFDDVAAELEAIVGAGTEAAR
jgi:acetyl esterase/lipase